jgi:hypothetical protein
VRQAFTNEVKSGMLVRKVGPWTTAENSAEAVAFSALPDASPTLGITWSHF